jgi:hypothetical protein
MPINDRLLWFQYSGSLEKETQAHRQQDDLKNVALILKIRNVE